MFKIFKHIFFLIVLLPSVLTGQVEIPYNDTTYFIPFDEDFNLIMSASKGHQNNVLNLLQRGADINAVTIDNISSLMYATENGDFLMVKLLLDEGANPNIRPFNGITALISAARLNLVEIAELLINNGADINAYDNEGITSLHYASGYNYHELLKMLLFYGADPKKPDKMGNVPIVSASWNNSIESVFVLLNHGIDINTRDKLGFTPLMVSLQNEHNDLATKLMEAGADINLVNEGGMTALAFAVMEGNYSISEILIQQGAKVNHNIRGSYNILELAKEKKDDEIIELLTNYGAKASLCPHFNQIGIGTGIHFNSQDFMNALDISLFESKYKTDLNGGFSFRPVAVRVLTDIENDTLFQFWERRYNIHGGLTKRIQMINTTRNLHSGPFAGANAVITFGGYRGSNSHPEMKVLFSPAAGWFLTSNRWFFQGSYQYMNFGISNLSPHRINISVAFKFNLVRNKMTEKKVEWLIDE